MNLGCVLEVEWSGLADGQNTTKSTDSQTRVLISDLKFYVSVVWKFGVLQGILVEPDVALLGPFQIHPQDGTKIYPEAKLLPSHFPWSFSQSKQNTPLSILNVPVSFFSPFLVLICPSVNLNSTYLQEAFYMLPQLDAQIKSHARVKLFRSFFPKPIVLGKKWCLD